MNVIKNVIRRLLGHRGCCNLLKGGLMRLSSPIEELKPHYTVVVIGSGYGGGIAASRLARAGQQVAVPHKKPCGKSKRVIIHPFGEGVYSG